MGKDEQMGLGFWELLRTMFSVIRVNARTSCLVLVALFSPAMGIGEIEGVSISAVVVVALTSVMYMILTVCLLLENNGGDLLLRSMRQMVNRDGSRKRGLLWALLTVGFFAPFIASSASVVANVGLEGLFKHEFPIVLQIPVIILLATIALVGNFYVETIAASLQRENEVREEVERRKREQEEISRSEDLLGDRAGALILVVSMQLIRSWIIRRSRK